MSREDFEAPVYPHITKAQWAVLSMMTDQRCANMMEAVDFVADLSAEAKEFLKSADKVKIEKLNANLEFFATSKAVWKFLWIGGGMMMTVLAVWKTLGDYITVKIK